MLNALHVLYHLISTIGLGNRYQYSYFVNEETDVEVINCAQHTKSMTNRGRTKISACNSPSHILFTNQGALTSQVFNINLLRVFVIKYGDKRGQRFLEYQDFLAAHNCLELC